MNDTSLPIGPAFADELPAAFALAFAQLPNAERHARVANALRLTAMGEVDPAGVLVARANGELAGVIVCLVLPGAGGLVWPPSVQPACEHSDLADQLVRAGLAWLSRGGSRLAQALLSSHEVPQAAPLVRGGLAHVTQLLYMQHDLDILPFARVPPLTWQTFSESTRPLFQQTLLRSYEGTLDCPELNGARTIEQILEGHMAQGKFRPEYWWLALERGAAAGVALAMELADRPVWDLSYVGVVPEARGRGVGRALTLRALQAARAARAPQLTLAVDVRNVPAHQLYLSLGFQPHETREVYLARLS